MDQDNTELEESHAIEPVDITIKYSFSSGLGGMENNRYRQEITGDIFHVDIDGDDIAQIGTLSADKLLMDIAINDGWGLFEVCDIGQALYEIGDVVYDFKNDDWRPKLNRLMGYTLVNRPLLILNYVHILPGYDALEIGKYVIKDVYNNFCQGVSLYVIVGFPLHSEQVHKENQPEWKLDTRKNWKMVKTFPNSFKNLVKFYKGLGFKYFPSLATDLMFMAVGQINPGFDSIVLE